jgi:hypothetical protein
MQQIRNIKYCEFEKFAEVVRSNETISGLPLVNGTDKPTDQTLANQGLSLSALGSGIDNSYTMSDLFGCMSGLPYSWQVIYDKIKEVETTKLRNIYQQNFLAVTWDAALVSIQYTSYIVDLDTYYTITGITLTNNGGGYGRGSAVAPIITISGGSGATAIATIGINDNDAGSNGTGTFGRVVNVSLTSPGTDTTTIPTITIECPPTANLPVTANGSVATGGTNTASGTDPWPSVMNAVIQAYINQANEEIASIQNAKLNASAVLNSYWDLCGTQLAREQRTRYIAFPPVFIVLPDSSSQVRKDYFTNLYPSSHYAFIDSVPGFSEDTAPHMTVPTLEAIADYDTTGGQSLVAMMREFRNRTRLLEMGSDLDNNIPDIISPAQLKSAYSVNIQTSVDQRLQYGVELNSYQKQALYGVEIVPQPISEPYIISVPLDVNPIIPTELDSRYTNRTLLPSSLSIQDAIDQVIECNCDCWI